MRKLKWNDNIAILVALLIFMLKAGNTTKNNRNASGQHKLTIVIVSQENGYHVAQANLLRSDLLIQALHLEQEPPFILLTHELSINGSWTIVPLLHVLENYPISSWYFFCMENTVVRLSRLSRLLSKFSTEKVIWIGHALYDDSPTIIHHFSDRTKKFKYPNFSSGFAMNRMMLERLVAILYGENGNQGSDFTIDAAYEFANFVLEGGHGSKLIHSPELCVVSDVDCTTYPKFIPACGNDVSVNKIFVAVKTCAKFHQDRIPVLQATWTKYATNIGFFTNKRDDLVTNVYITPDTNQGHCAKTYSILKQAASIMQNQNLDWLVLSDDDTLFSLARLLRWLSCYNPRETIAIGERYGFQMMSSSGYEYLTGGAGVVLSAPLINLLTQPGICECPTATTPDDMYIFGVCLARLGVKPIHSPLFHQARAVDYATAYLASQEPISFHKFWMIDPVKEYLDWFSAADSQYFSSKKRKHEEL